MARVRPLVGGGQEVEVQPARLGRFLDGAARRHGAPITTTVTDAGPRVTMTDGTTVDLVPIVGGLEAYSGAGLVLAPLLAHLARPWRVGLLLVRAGGHSAGVAVGGAVVSSSTGRRHVQGRSAAGGWSQQRFARRRAGQTRASLEQAADTAVRALLGSHLDVLVTGGDRRGVETVLADPRLTPLRALVSWRWLDVPEPRRTVLDEAAVRANAVLARVVPDSTTATVRFRGGQDG